MKTPHRTPAKPFRTLIRIHPLLALSRAIAFSLALISSTPAMSFEIFPEYRSLSEAETEDFDLPSRLDSEYESDVLAFQTPLSFDAEMFARANAFDLSLGSLSGKQFLHNQRLTLQKDLLENLRFRFTHFIQRDFEENENRAILELQLKVAEKVRLALYGEPARDKEEDDLGLAMLLYPEKGHEIRLYHTWTDIVRKKRSLEGDRFVGPQNPSAIGLTGRRLRMINGDEIDSFLHYAIHWETPTRWYFPQSQSEYRYDRFIALFENLFPLKNTDDGGRLKLETRVQWDRKSEAREDLTTAPSAIADSGWDRDRFRALLAVHWKPSTAKWTLRPGLSFSNRHWRTIDGQTIDQRHWLPHAWLDIPLSEINGRQDHLQVGLEATTYEGSGPARYFGSQGPVQRWERRANLRYEFNLRDRARLAFFASADLDAFGTGHTFEGGHGQFLVFF